MKTAKRILAVIGRSLLIALSVLVILLSIAGMFGAWYADKEATNITLKLFSVVETGVSVVDSGVSQALDRVSESRNEITQLKTDIETLGQNLEKNKPVLTSLSERLDTKLAPAINRIQAVIGPVQDGLVAADAVLSVANSVPFFQEKAPRLQNIQDTIQTVQDTGADVQQLRVIIREAAAGKSTSLTEQGVKVLLDTAGRIDDRLATIQSDLEDLQAQVDALSERIAAKKAALLLIYNLTAAFLTLLFAWVIYSQVVVIIAQIGKLRSPDSASSTAEPLPAPADTAPKAPESSDNVEKDSPAKPEAEANAEPQEGEDS